eukprot:960577_1
MHMLTIPSIAIIAYGFSLICTRLNYAYVIISPTMSDVDTEYYFSNTSDEFEWGYILCAAEKPNCEIKCHADSTCEWLTVNASLTQNLLLECDGSDACDHITVYGPDVSVNVQCISPISCQYGVFQFDDTKRVNITCDGWSDTTSSSHACRYSEINAAMAEDLNLQCMGRRSCFSATLNGTFVSNSILAQCNDHSSCSWLEIHGSHAQEVNVFCKDTDTVSYSCQDLTVYCPSERENQCNFDCDAGGGQSCKQIDVYHSDNYTIGFLNVTMDACSSAPEYCSSFDSFCIDSGSTTAVYYTPTFNQSYCEDYDCCPITDYKPNLTCEDDSDCVINCTAINDPFDIQCLRATIDARNANSLTLLCGTFEGCMCAKVTCPVGNCTVICSGDITDNACENLAINASLSTNTNIQCLGGCEWMKVYATNNVDVNVLCTGHCGGSEFYLANTPTVHVVCNGDNSCGFKGNFRTEFYVENTINADIVCDSTGSCHGMIVKAMGSDNVNVDCRATSGLASCEKLLLYCPETEASCNLQCADTTNISNYGSCEDAAILFSSDWILDPFAPVLNLSCPANENDCQSLKFDCRHYDGGSINTGNTLYEWKAAVQQYSCEYDSLYFCCAKYDEIVCEPDQDCIVVCNDTQRCSSTVINAKYATSLTVSCAEYASCHDTYFECPLDSKASCSLDCSGDCYRAHVFGNGATQVDLQCQSCSQIAVRITADDSTCNVNCTSCSSADFRNYGTNAISNIHCDGTSACRSSIISANASKSVMLSCTGSSACNQNTMYVTAEDVSIDCNSRDACANLNWRLADSGHVTVNANANYSFSDSWNTRWHSFRPPYKSPNSTRINCGIDHECYALEMKLEDEVAVDFLDISCNDPTDGCANVSVFCSRSGGHNTFTKATTLFSPSGTYYCDPQSTECCPFGNTDGETTQSPQTTGSSPTTTTGSDETTQASQTGTTMVDETIQSDETTTGSDETTHTPNQNEGSASRTLPLLVFSLLALFLN